MGNMIGSGVFLLPAALAPYGAISMIGWLASSVGAILLALVLHGSRVSVLLQVDRMPIRERVSATLQDS